MADPASRTYDAIIIPGGGLEPGSSLPQPWVRGRLDEALKRSTNTKYFIVLSRGTTHRAPPNDSAGFPIDESSASAKYLIDHGIDDTSRILMDSWSLDTIGNAFFTRQMFCEPLLLRKLLVVTSQFHMPRTKAIFDWVFRLNNGDASVDYCVTGDHGLDDAQRSVRVAKEQNSLQTLKKVTIPRVDSLFTLSQFVFQEHGAYNAESARNVKTIGSHSQRQDEKESHESVIRSTY